MSRVLLAFLVSMMLSPTASAQDADTRYRTGRALGITGVTAQPFVANVAIVLTVAGSPQSTKGDDGKAVLTPAKPGLVAGGFALRTVSSVGLPLMAHLGALQSSRALGELGGVGSQELSYAGLGVQGLAAAMNLTRSGLAFSMPQMDWMYAIEGLGGASALTAWILGIVHVDRNHRRYRRLDRDEADASRRLAWDAALPGVPVLDRSLPGGGHLHVTAGVGGVGMSGVVR